MRKTFTNVKRKKKNRTYSNREVLLNNRCSACEIGIGVSNISINGEITEFHHEQREPVMYRNKAYCDSCYESRVKKREAVAKQ